MDVRLISRRKLLGRGLLAATSALVSARLAHARDYGAGQGVPWTPGAADPPYYGTEPGLFFSERERRTADALTARLIPSDDTGPGAREAGVVTFIDRQLAGFYGRAQRWYMSGPFPEPLATQGYQSEHTPAGLWRAGLAGLNVHCQATHGDRDFADLSEAEQDAVLTAMDEEEIEFARVSAKLFFDFAMEMTVEGFFSDPVYGGNRDMVGWRYVGFPGARYDYRDFLGHNGARVDIPPVGLFGRPEWTR